MSRVRESQNNGDWSNMLNTLARLYVAGVDLDWSSWYGTGQALRGRKLPLPTYAFDRQRYWYNRTEEEDDDEENVALSSGGSGKLCHPVLGRQLACPCRKPCTRRG